VSVTLFLGYGSLLSARGLGPQLESTHDAELAWIDAPRRFGKPPQKGGRLAMEVVARSALLTGRSGRAPERERGCGALLLHVGPEGEGRLVRREGYPPKCWAALRAKAGRQPPAEFLADLAESSEDVLAFRARLWALTGPPKSGIVHYLPHPVRLDDGRVALVFVAPDPGQTGSSELPSCKEAHPGLRGVGLSEVYEHGREVISDWSDALQTDYVELCLLGLAHGIYLADLFAEDLAPEHPALRLLAELRAKPERLLAERSTLQENLSGLRETYAERFAPDLETAWAWSGLPR
jgi:hypothetical protein